MNASGPSTELHFGPFRFDTVNQCLWRGRQRLLLRPKTFAVLQVLLKQAGRLVTRAALFDAVWPDTVVSDDVLRFCIRDARKALQDTTSSPRFIETVHRRGYRFIAPLRLRPHGKGVGDAAIEPTASQKTRPQTAIVPSPLDGEPAPRHAQQETITHLIDGITLLQTSPSSIENVHQELALRLAVSAPLIASRGHGSMEVQQIYTQARELCRQAGETSQLFPVLWGLTVNAIVKGELQLAREASERMFALAHTLQDPVRSLEAEIVHGALLLWLGEVEAGNAHLESSLTRCDMQQQSSHTFLYGHDARVICRVLASKAQWLLGHAERALQQAQAALSLATASSHVYSLSFALNWITMLQVLHRKPETAHEHAQTATKIAHEQGFAHLEAVATILWGSTLAKLNSPEEGIAQMQQGLRACLTTGAELARPYFLSLLAESCVQEGRSEEALRIINEALAVGQKTGECWYEAELYRLKGEILLHPGVQQQKKATGVLTAGRAVVRSRLPTRMPHQQKRLSPKERESSKATDQQ